MDAVICFRCYDEAAWARTINPRRGPWKRHVSEPPVENLSLRDWILHAVVHADLHDPLLALGFLDAERDLGLIFWRWDPWNARMAAEIRRRSPA